MTPGQQERARGELDAAEQALEIGGLALERTALRDATSRLYYACVHVARAALTVKGIDAKTHSGLVGLFTQTYGSAPTLAILLERRTEADYSFDPFGWSKSDVQGLADEATAFVQRCRQIVEEALAEGPSEPDPPPDA